MQELKTWTAQSWTRVRWQNKVSSLKLDTRTVLPFASSMTASPISSQQGTGAPSHQLKPCPGLEMLKGGTVAATKKLLERKIWRGGEWKFPYNIKISKKVRKINTKTENKIKNQRLIIESIVQSLIVEEWRHRKCIKGRKAFQGKVNVLKTGLFPGHLFSAPFPPFSAIYPSLGKRFWLLQSYL